LELQDFTTLKSSSYCLTVPKKGAGTQESRKALLAEQRDRLAQQIAQLQKILKKLDYKIANYGTAVLAVEKKLVW
jgi:DNA-binding transcriptional MerR regulator